MPMWEYTKIIHLHSKQGQIIIILTYLKRTLRAKLARPKNNCMEDGWKNPTPKSRIFDPLA